MAEEFVKIVTTIEAEGSRKSLAGLREEIKKYREEMLNAEKGSAQWTAAAKGAADAQTLLDEVMKASRPVVEKQIEVVEKTGKSLQDLRDEIKNYREEMLNSVKGSTEWTTAANAAAKAQEQLDDIMKASRPVVEKVVEVVEKTGKSFRDLRTDIQAYREQMLNATEGSAEWNKAANLARIAQEQLDKVMQASKPVVAEAIESNDKQGKSLRDLRMELRGYREEMINAEEGSQAWIDAVRKAGVAQERLDDIMEISRGAAIDWREAMSGTLGAVSKTLSGLSGLYTAYNGIAAITGKENERLEQTFVKVQGAMALTQGLTSVATAFGNLGKTLNTLRGIMLAHPITFWATIIATLAAGIGVLISAMQKEEDRVKSLREEYNKLDATFTRLTANQKYYLDVLKAQGATEAQIAQERIKQANFNKNAVEDEIRTRERAIAQLNLQLADLKDNVYGYDKAEYQTLEQTLVLEQERLQIAKERLPILEQESIEAVRLYNTTVLTAETSERQAEAKERELLAQKAIAEAAERQRIVQETETLNITNSETIISGSLDTKANEKYLEDYQKFLEAETELLENELQKRIGLNLEFGQATLAERQNLIQKEITLEQAKTDAISASLKSVANLVAGQSVLAKAAAVASATWDTYAAANKALASAPPPFGQILAAAAIVQGLANVRSIVSTNVGTVNAAPSNNAVPPVVQTVFTQNAYDQETINPAPNFVPVLVVDDVNKVQQKQQVIVSETSFE